MFSYITAGESHGQSLLAIIQGLPSGLCLSAQDINPELERRQRGFGRGQRMTIEKDQVRILSGVRFGKTLGSPVALEIDNHDWAHWQEIMRVEGGSQAKIKPVTRPRPGHADLAGVLKYRLNDIRDVLERASARETAVRTAVGACAKKLLCEYSIQVVSHVVRIGDVVSKTHLNPLQIQKTADLSPVRMADKNAEKRAMNLIEKMKRAGDALGGVIEILVVNVPVGLGSYTHWEDKLDGNIARALMSIQAIKGVDVGLGFQAGQLPGSRVHDAIYYHPSKRLFYRKTNGAGGIEGGMSNGQTIVIRAAMKPISTLMKPLNSVDIHTKKVQKASMERSDVCAVPSASVIGEAVVAIEIAKAMREKFGGDSLFEMKQNFKHYVHQLETF